MKIAKKLTDLVGNTPLLELSEYSHIKNLKTNIIAKLECFNPLGSTKDRVALSMVEDAQSRGIISKGSTIIEPTSGNTGIGLAFVAVSKGMRLILTMPETMSVERRNLLKALGAEVVLTPGSEGMAGAIRRSEEMNAQIEGSVILRQFENPANPEIHRRTTGEEIWRDTDGRVDIFVAGVGTGGTISGVGQCLKSKKPEVKVIAVEPKDSPVLSGGKPSPHKIQGIGAGFVPVNFDREVVDDIIQVSSEDAYKCCIELAQTEGLLVGVSSGAALWAASQLALQPQNKSKNIVVLLTDSGERYLSVEGLF